MANQNERPQYTDISIVKAVSSNGNSTYNRVVFPKILIDASRMSPVRDVNISGQDGSPATKKVCDISVPIKNRAEIIGKACGITPPEKDETSWAKVTFWGDNAERITNFLGNHSRCIMTIEGAITVTQNNGYTNTNISVDRWTFQRDVKSNNEQGSGQGSYAPQNSNNAQGYQQPQGNSAPVFSDLSDCDDGELPF